MYLTQKDFCRIGVAYKLLIAKIRQLHSDVTEDIGDFFFKYGKGRYLESTFDNKAIHISPTLNGTLMFYMKGYKPDYYLGMPHKTPEDNEEFKKAYPSLFNNGFEMQINMMELPVFPFAYFPSVVLNTTDKINYAMSRTRISVFNGKEIVWRYFSSGKYINSEEYSMPSNKMTDVITYNLNYITKRIT